ncbi:ATPase [Dehalobacter sp. DCM]|uniref:cell division FtsA domain-containing protein n=1 Tax=Dehalobacter sp. DCM TaxID=2907827 RepID=UPI003081D3A9|nr:ATPase [Dehalobacter sp. DCM]
MEQVFVIDIGTRAVIGIIARKTEEGYEIVASARTEHTQRSMYDGQVHDVNEVAKAVSFVKLEIENQLNCRLTKVAVAAAGRALCTETAAIIREEVLPKRWDQEEVLSMEMEAVQKAMKKISLGETEDVLFYCVGYSTVMQILEDQVITSLVGQRGRKAELSVIASFLPRTVVDGLIAVLAKSGLEMESLTLEPIAAGLAAIPEDMRRLNLALVDIGAGTSDIAMTKDGTFFAYGMVPMAGDEVTEAICSHYLVDFHEGEKIKKQLNENEEIIIKNFFGNTAVVRRQEILELIEPTVKVIAERIGGEIRLLNNNKAPQAAILVGGGSLTPLIADCLAQVLQLKRSRVGIQVRERLPMIKGQEKELTGSDVITSIGIAISALLDKGLHYYTVTVNNMRIPLFELQMATVAEGLLAAGLQPRTFYGRPGAALIYKLNNDIQVIKGELGTPAQIIVNGEIAKLDQRLHPGDEVTFVSGYSGKDAAAQVKDVIEFPPAKKIIWNGREEEFKALIYLNNKPADPEEWLEDGCILLIRNNETLADLLKLKGIVLTKTNTKKVKVNGQWQELTSAPEMWINQLVAAADSIIHEGDSIDYIEKKKTIRDLKLRAEPMRFSVNGQPFDLPPFELRIFCQGKLINENDLVEDGMELRVEGFSRRPILSELFPYLNLSDNTGTGGKLEMKVNGNEAHFTTELHQGDRIIVNWINKFNTASM